MGENPYKDDGCQFRIEVLTSQQLNQNRAIIIQAHKHNREEKQKMFNEEVMRARVERMNGMLNEAAVEGSVTSLIQLLQEDKLVLDRFVVGSFPETPLHVSVMLGHIEFIKMILDLKPEIAGELDFQRSSPLHLAAAKGYVEIVKLLLSADPEMCFAQDLEGRNPLHVAVMKGRLDALKELVRARPQAARTLVDRSGTILHLCVKHNQLEALKLLVEIINDNDFTNSKDDDGFTILHLAVAEKKIEIINFLITGTTLEVNTLNANGLTALDILTNGRRDMKDIEIGESLRRVGALRANDSHLSARVDVAISPMNSLSGPSSDPNRQKNWLEQKRNALMVVASLIATMAFQASSNQPGHDVDRDSYSLFMVYNSVSFIASLSIILLLISGLPLKNRVFVWILMVIMWIAIISIAFAYLVFLSLLAPGHDFAVTLTIVYSIYAWIGFLLLSHTIRLIVKLVKYVISKLKGKRRSYSVIRRS